MRQSSAALALPAAALPDSCPTRSSAPRSLDSFTLLEVILALGIAAAILGVILFFYAQSDKLRNDLLRETAHVTAVRVLLARLTTELSLARCCDAFQKGLSGGPDNIQFVKLDIPGPALWTNSIDTNSVDTNQLASVTAYRLVSYSLLVTTNLNTNQVADATSDTNTVTNTFTNDAPTATLNDTTNPPVVQLIHSEESLLRRRPDSLTGDLDQSVSNAPPPRRVQVLTDQIQFLRFRYWDGATWQDSWNALDLPAGVEVSVGIDPLPPDLTPDQYPGELFRRLIYLPLSRLNNSTNVVSANTPGALPQEGSP